MAKKTSRKPSKPRKSAKASPAPRPMGNRTPNSAYVFAEPQSFAFPGFADAVVNVAVPGLFRDIINPLVVASHEACIAQGRQPTLTYVLRTFSQVTNCHPSAEHFRTWCDRAGVTLATSKRSQTMAAKKD